MLTLQWPLQCSQTGRKLPMHHFSANSCLLKPAQTAVRDLDVLCTAGECSAELRQGAAPFGALPAIPYVQILAFSQGTRPPLNTDVSSMPLRQY